MIKAKFRDHVRSKSADAMVNEVLCKMHLSQRLLPDPRVPRTWDQPRWAGATCSNEDRSLTNTAVLVVDSENGKDLPKLSMICRAASP